MSNVRVPRHELPQEVEDALEDLLVAMEQHADFIHAQVTFTDIQYGKFPTVDAIIEDGS